MTNRFFNYNMAWSNNIKVLNPKKIHVEPINEKNSSHEKNPSYSENESRNSFIEGAFDVFNILGWVIFIIIFFQVILLVISP